MSRWTVTGVRSLGVGVLLAWADVRLTTLPLAGRPARPVSGRSRLLEQPLPFQAPGHRALPGRRGKCRGIVSLQADTRPFLPSCRRGVARGLGRAQTRGSRPAFLLPAASSPRRRREKVTVVDTVSYSRGFQQDVGRTHVGRSCCRVRGRAARGPQLTVLCRGFESC